jgi:tetratricopeptide (TPR) repeat protein
MRRIGVLVLAAVCLRAGSAAAQQEYASVLLQYLTGDADAAIVKVRSLDPKEIVAGFNAFNTTRSRLVLPGAAALHTEAALRTRANGFIGTFQLDVATAIVQFGEPIKVKPLPGFSINPARADPVSDDFRRLWYCAVIGVLEDTSRLKDADRYLDHALELYPDNGELHLLAGVAGEMRGSPRISGLSGGERRRGLEDAAKHYRAAVAAQPDRLEARLRLGRVLQQRAELNDARTLLAPLTDATDDRIAYLAGLFLGGVEDADHHADAALAAYDKAGARVPRAQAARIAASELRHRKGERQAAADAVPPAAGADNTSDPWWTYVFGEYWRPDMLLDALRKLRRAA